MTFKAPWPSRTRRPRLLALLAAVTLGLLPAACGDQGTNGAADEGHDDDHGGTSGVADGARRIEVKARSFAFDPDEIRATEGEKLAIVLTSTDILHDFTIDELDAHVLAKAGKTETGGFTATEAGRFDFYCSVPGHRRAGMEGTLVVE